MKVQKPGPEAGQTGLASVDGQETCEKAGPGAQSTQNPAPKARPPVKQQEQARHEHGDTDKIGVPASILRQVAVAERACQYHGLAESQADPFAGDGIHRQCRIPHQSDAP